MTEVKLLKIKKPKNYVPISNGRTKVPDAAIEHPRPDRLRKVAEQFRKFAKVESNKLEFSRISAPTPKAARTNIGCGTVACHAGWAIPALINIKVFSLDDKPDSSNTYFEYTNFITGDEELGIYLFDQNRGDYPEKHLDIWASENPSLFGGTNGSTMFTSHGSRAFVQNVETDGILDFNLLEEANEIVTLNAIADRYDDIAYRIEQKFYK